MKPIFQGIDLFARNRGWLRWQQNRPRELLCPACQKTSLMTSRLDTASPAHKFRRFTLYECSICQTGHFADLKAPAYEGKKPKSGERIRETAALKYYLEQGAGLLSMVQPFLPLVHRKKLSLLEIGTGYGLALHFAREALGWQVTGYDPSSLARVGAEDLDLNILPIYLDQHTTLETGPVDLVYSSEVIEHVADPDGFLRPLKQALKPEGILILTTPDIAGLVKERPLDSLLPLVSPGSHLILFSKAGLKHTLKRAGFTHITITSSGDTLIAYGSATKQSLTDKPSPQLFRKYLAKQTDKFRNHRQLFSGFCGRLFKEQVNAGKFAAAEKTLQQLNQCWLKQYQLDLNKLDDFQFPDPNQLRFEKFAQRLPLNLPMVLYHAGVLAMNHNSDMERAIQRFEACLISEQILQAALLPVNVVDLETRILAGYANALVIGLRANAQTELASQRLTKAKQAGFPKECKSAYANAQLDVFSAAANTGQWEIARPLANGIDQDLRHSGITNSRQRSAATGLAMIALNDMFDRQQGLFWLNMALVDAPNSEPWNGLRYVWGEHAAASGSDLLAAGGNKLLAEHKQDITSGLLARPAKTVDLAVLLALAEIYADNHPDQTVLLVERAMKVAHKEKDRALICLIETTKLQLFLTAISTANHRLIDFWLEQMQAMALEGDGPQSLYFALGLDQMNRKNDPISACNWLDKASNGPDQDLANEATNALAIAHQQIRDQIITAANNGNYQQISQWLNFLPAKDNDPQTIYALAMYDLNFTNKPQSAADQFALAAKETDNQQLRDNAFFHQSLALARQGETKAARKISQKLFAINDQHTLSSILISRKRELETEIRQGERSE